MPSSEPLEITIETFSIVSGSATAVCGFSRSSVIVCSFLDAALGLGDAADLGGEFGRPLGEELVELLDRDAGFLSERSDRGGGAGGEVALAHEADDQPVPVAHFGNAALTRDRLRDRLVPLLRVDEEALGIDVDRSVCDQGHGHRRSSLAQALTVSRFLPAVGMAGPMPGISRPGS